MACPTWGFSREAPALCPHLMPLLYKNCCFVRPWDLVKFFSSLHVLAGPWPRMLCCLLVTSPFPLSQACGQVFHQAHFSKCLWLGGLKTQQCFLLLGRSHMESPGPCCCVTRLTAHREIPGWWQCPRMLLQRLLYFPLDMKKRCRASISPRLQRGLWIWDPVGAILENKEPERGSVWSCCKE